MEFRSLDYFLAVAESPSLRAAAQRLGLTQPALTKAIRRLEDSFQVPLFDRKARGVTLTIYGEAVLRHARDLGVSLGAAHDEVAALKQGLKGLVRVGAGPSWQDAVLPEAISELRADRPDIQVRVLGGTDDHLKRLLKSGEVDLVLAAVPDAPRLEPELVWRPLLRDEYAVIADVKHPLRRKSATLEDLLNYPWILPARTTYMVQRFAALLRAHGLPAPEAAIETDVIALKFALMRDAPYLSIHAVSHMLAAAPSFVQRLPVDGTITQRDAGIIVMRNARQSPSAEALEKILTRRCRDMSARPSAMSVRGACKS